MKTALTILSSTALAMTIPAQSTMPSSLCVSGDAIGSWVTSMGESPISKGTFRLQIQGDQAWLRVDLPGVGVLVHGCDGDQVWAIDPEAGPVFRTGEAARADRQMFALLRADLAAAEELAPDAMARDAGWKRSGDTLQSVEQRTETAIGEPVRRTLTFSEWSDRDGHTYPSKFSILQNYRRINLEVREYSTAAKAIESALFSLDPELAEVAKSFHERGQSKDALGCEFIDVEQRHVAFMRTKVAASEISKEMGRMLPAIMMHVRKSGAATTGAPYSRYHNFDGKHFDLECGVPVQEKVKPGGGVKAGTLPAGRAATTWHIGPYQELVNSHNRLQEWVLSQKMAADGGLWEIYWTDPGLERDPSKWRTQLVQPVQAAKRKR